MDIEQLAREAGFITKYQGLFEHQRFALERFANLVRNAVLEEAAAKCEEISDEYGRREGLRYPELKTDAQSGASDCEAAIRSMKKE